jgi:hypothetical protein
MTASWYLNGNPVLNPAAVVTNGTYTLIGNNAGGCTDTVRVLLSVSQKPNIGPDQSHSICSGTSLNLTSLYTTGANTPAWYFGGAPFATPASATNGGVYTLIVTAINGCTDTAQVTLSVQPVPVLGPDQTQGICSYATLDLNTLYATAGYTTSWTNGGVSVSNPASVNTAGVYTLIASAGAACADTAQVTVSLLPTPALGPDQNAAICSGYSVDLTGIFTTTGFTSNWTCQQSIRGKRCRDLCPDSCRRRLQRYRSSGTHQPAYPFAWTRSNPNFLYQ